MLRKLTFDDLRDWAGETILNRGNSYVKRVDQLKVMPADFEKAADHWEHAQEWIRDVFLGS